MPGSTEEYWGRQDAAQAIALVESLSLSLLSLSLSLSLSYVLCSFLSICKKTQRFYCSNQDHMAFSSLVIPITQCVEIVLTATTIPNVVEAGKHNLQKILVPV